MSVGGEKTLAAPSLFDSPSWSWLSCRHKVNYRPLNAFMTTGTSLWDIRCSISVELMNSDTQACHQFVESYSSSTMIPEQSQFIHIDSSAVFYLDSDLQRSGDGDGLQCRLYKSKFHQIHSIQSFDNMATSWPDSNRIIWPHSNLVSHGTEADAEQHGTAIFFGRGLHGDDASLWFLAVRKESDRYSRVGVIQSHWARAKLKEKADELSALPKETFRLG